MSKKSELPILDDKFVQEVKNVLQIQYGFISIEEPVLHIAVANAAAIDVILNKMVSRTDIIDQYINEQTGKVSDEFSELLKTFSKSFQSTLRKDFIQIQSEALEQVTNSNEAVRVKLIREVEQLIKEHQKQTQCRPANKAQQIISKITWFVSGFAVALIIAAVINAYL